MCLKNNLQKENGKIKFPPREKSELIRIEAFNEIDIAITHHVHIDEIKEHILIGNKSTNGFISKSIRYQG